jgi:hypothetical protein
MDMFSLSREAAQYSNIDRKTSVGAQEAARKQSVPDRRSSYDRRPSNFSGFGQHDSHPAVSIVAVVAKNRL